MSHRNNFKLTVIAGTIASACGAASAQTGDQGTILRQRDRLDDAAIAPLTSGWLSESVNPRFWSWELATSVTDFSGHHPDMQLWIQHRFWSGSLSSASTISTSSLDSQAQGIANTILARLASTGPDAISDGNYAICLLGLTGINLHDHPTDALDDMSDLYIPASGLCEQWADLPPNATDLDRASIWRANGAAVADAAIEYLTDEIVSRVLAGGASFPAPLRIFFDEERGRTHGMNSLDNIGEIESMQADARWSTQALHGNFSMWDSTPSTTYGSEVFSSQPLADIVGWRAACNPFIPGIYGVPINAYSATNSTHQNPWYDHEFYPINLLHNGVLNAAIDGAFVPALDHPSNDADWAGFKWSNYGTSVYYSPSYPRISSSDHGSIQPAWPPHEGFGFAQLSTTGSAPIQSPVLYPPSDFWETEVGDEDGTSVVETEAEAWLRHARMELDHAIFSFADFDDLGIEVPRHIAPWVTRVGTIVHRPGVGNDYDITSKNAVRDIIALCKAKGVNEILFWGNPGAESGARKCDDSSTNPQYNWNSTNDAIAQVFDYHLNGVQVGPFWLGGTVYPDLTFSEEHAFDFSPTLNGSMMSTAFAPRFSTGPVTTPSSSYAFVLETIDGGGPWDGAAYLLEIYNYDTASYETITGSPTELFSSSGRRAVFTDTDSDGYSNDWQRTFDDQSDMPSGTFVTDRKTIQKWDVALPIGGAALADYISGGNMQFRLTASHSSIPGVDKKADPLRVDLVQLYETECENDNIVEESQSRTAGDLTGDGAITRDDLVLFNIDNPDADLNRDGRVNALDLKILLDAIAGL